MSGINLNNLISIQTHTAPAQPSLTAHRTLNMALLNIRSFSNKTFLINELILDKSIDCMFLTEMWLGSDGPASLIEAPPNYGFSYSYRKGKRGGGTATILSNSLSFKDVLFDEFTSFEYHAFVFNSPPILCLTVYRPPKRCTAFITEFSELLSLSLSLVRPSGLMMTMVRP